MSAASSAGTDESRSRRSMSNYELPLPETMRREIFRRRVIAPMAVAWAAPAAGAGEKNEIPMTKHQAQIHKNFIDAAWSLSWHKGLLNRLACTLAVVVVTLNLSA